MNWLNIILISINLIFGYFVYLRMNQNGRHLGLNRYYLIAFPIFAIALGLIYHYSNGQVLNGFRINLPLIEINGIQNAVTSVANINWIQVIYILGVCGSVLHLLWSFGKVRKPTDAKFLNQLGKQRIYLISDKHQSFSHLNNVYLSEYQLDNSEFILKHELAHCRQKHSLDLIFIRLIRSLFWFHPVLYLWERKMKENHEFMADRASIENQGEVKSYSYALLSSHFGVSVPELAHGFNRQSLLQKRIIQLKTQNTINMKKVILIPIILVGVVLMTSIQLESNQSNELITTNSSTEKSKGDIDANPEFSGGMSALISYMQENVKYPKDLANKNLEAKVFVKFVVSNKGKVKNVEVSRGSEHEAFNEEAVRVISSMPDWKPGVKNGKAVSAEMTLPIQFALAK